MLKKKLILIVSIILLFSLCLVSVSATDSSLINGTDSYGDNLQSSNLDLNNTSNIASDYNTKLNSEDGPQIILDNNGNGGSFRDLQNLIDSNTNGTIDLDKDYKYSENDNLPNGITINGKTLVINGNGHTLDGSSLARIFNISDSNLELNDLKLINGMNNESGTAIFANNSKLNINGCSFNNNTVNINLVNYTKFLSVNGGTIHLLDSTANINNSNFTNSNVNFSADDNYKEKATVNGGGIFSKDSNLNISNCLFNDNHLISNYTHVVFSGSAICTDDNINTTIVDSNFTNNNCSYGTIDDASENLIINNCLFNNNYANEGSDIYLESDVYNTTISNSKFINSHSESDGGSIYSYSGSEDGSIIFNNCSFINTSSGDDGGALYINSETNILDFNNCSFINTSASGGGAIWYDDGTASNVNNCTFINCTALTYDGGAILNDGINVNVTVRSSRFINCTASRQGGAISHTPYGYHYFTVINSTFYNNTAEEAGAIYISDEDLGRIYNSTFVNNSAHSEAGAISCNKQGEYNYGIDIIEGNIFINNTAPKAGAISICGGNISNCVIIDNPDNNNHDVVSNGYWENSVNLTYNWWGSNKNPIDRYTNNSENGIVNHNWVLMTFVSNETVMFVGNTYNLTAGLTQYTDGKNINGFNQYLPIRNVSFTAKTGVYDHETGALVNNKLNTLYSKSTTNNTLYATIDYQTLELPIFEAKIFINKTPNLTAVKLGDELSYIVVVKNIGDYNLTKVYFNENIPENLRYIKFSGDNWTVNDKNNAFYYLNTLEPNQTANITLYFKAVKEGNFTNAIVVNTHEIDNITINSTEVQVISNDTNRTNNTNSTNNTNNNNKADNNKANNNSNIGDSYNENGLNNNNAAIFVENSPVTGIPVLVLIITLLSCVFIPRRKN